MCAGLVLTLMTAGCEPDTDPPEPPVATTSPQPMGSTFRFGVHGEPATLDPYSPNASDLTWHLVRPVYRSVFRFAPDGSPVADLAGDVRQTGSGAVISLRRVTWSNGDRVMPKDVALSLTRSIEAGRLRGVTGARVDGDAAVRVEGRADDWATLLAQGSLVLPGGRADLEMASGPLRIRSRRAGLQVVYERNPEWAGKRTRTKNIVVQFVQSPDVMFDLLENRRLDGAAPPSLVNLEERVTALGLESAAALGTERVFIDLEGSDLTTAERTFIANTIDRPAMQEGFVRDTGELDGSLPEGSRSKPLTELVLAAPGGDELLVLIQRVAQERLKAVGVPVDLVVTDPRTFYSEWAVDDPFDLAVRRTFGEIDGARAIRLFRVETAIAYRPGTEGLAVNPSLDGPLWNVEEWYVKPQ
ncbi:MAG TPA: ABC transporter substrate-binding protein [Actinomycetota bacterium]|nr:ABC transporter substrate-binding protein [Actinomycetota bacterium]